MYKVNQIINVKVSSIKSFGIFVIVDEYYTGLIHISQITGKYIKNINNIFKVGDVIKAKIIEVDDNRKQLKLSTIGLINKSNILEETPLGFDLFKEILQEWIDEKLDEMK